MILIKNLGTFAYCGRGNLSDMNSNRFTAMYRPQSSKKYDTISAASCWENRSKAGLLQALEIICFRYFKKEEGSKATLDLWSNNRTY